MPVRSLSNSNHLSSQLVHDSSDSSSARADILEPISHARLQSPSQKISGRSTVNLFAFALTVLFFAIGLVGIAHHEMWRDELRAWLIARESSTIYQLFDILRYEGTPPLWHLCLFGLTRFTADPLAMQIFHLFLASACIFIVARFSPFAFWQRALIAIGYFPFFEYAQISRSYVLSNLFLFAICALCSNGRRNYPLLLLCLILLASTTIYGAIFAFSIGAALLLERVEVKERNLRFPNRRVIAAGLGTLAVSLFLFGALIKPPPDAFLGDWHAYDKKFFIGSNQIVWRVTKSASTILTAYLPVPEPAFKNQFWGSTIFQDREPARYAWAVMSVLIFILVGRWLKDALSRTSYVLGTLGFVAFTFIFYVGSSRHNGMLFILLLACTWMALDCRRRASRQLSDSFQKSDVRQQSVVLPKSDARQQRSDLQLLLPSKDKQLPALLFSAILVVNALVGGFAFYTDFRETFSPTRDIANYLKEQNLDKYRLVVTPDSCGTGLSALLQRPVYSLANFKEITFERFNSERQQVWGYDIPWRVSRLVQWWDQPFLLLSRERLYTELRMGHATLLKRINRTIASGEGKYLYLVVPDKTVNSTNRDAIAHSMFWQVWPTQRVQRLFNNELCPKWTFGKRKRRAPSWYVRLRPVECSKAVP